VNAILSIVYQFATNGAFLLLSAIGLVVILGMMNVINLAHGEFMMMGAFITEFCYTAGVPLLLCVVISFFVVALVGALFQRFLIARFLGHEMSAMIVTWGLSLILAQGALLMFGPSLASIPIPFGAGTIGSLSFSWYWILLICVAALLLISLWFLYYHTKFGLRARAAMQERDMARALGVRVNKVYTWTFALGSGLAGLSGALLAPNTTIAPFMGQQYLAPAFITVVTGGSSNVIAGALASAGLLSLAETPVTIWLGTFLGVVAMMCASLILIRLLPNGLSEWIQRRFLS
jgi:branched-chain amino acid transport system permease protein